MAEAQLDRPQDAATVPRANAAADRIDRYLRRTIPIWIVTIAAAAVAITDLATGWAGHGRRLDLVLVGAGVAGFWAPLNARRLARRIRSGELRRRPTRRDWVRTVASMVGSLLFTGGFGFIIGGWRPLYFCRVERLPSPR